MTHDQLDNWLSERRLTHEQQQAADARSARMIQAIFGLGDHLHGQPDKPKFKVIEGGKR